MPINFNFELVSSELLVLTNFHSPKQIVKCKKPLATVTLKPCKVNKIRVGPHSQRVHNLMQHFHFQIIHAQPFTRNLNALCLCMTTHASKYYVVCTQLFTLLSFLEFDSVLLQCNNLRGCHCRPVAGVFQGGFVSICLIEFEICSTSCLLQALEINTLF